MEIAEKSSILYRAEVINKIFNGADYAGIPYCILRNYSGLPNSTLGGDIDLIISPNNKKDWRAHLESVVLLHDLDLGVIQVHYHGIRYCVFNVKKSIFLKLDVHYGEYWRGVEYMSADHIFKSVKLFHSFRIPSNENEAILSLLDPLVTGGKARPKYEDIVVSGINNKNKFVKTLRDIVGESVAGDIVYFIENGKYMEISTLSNKVRWNLWFRMFFKSYGGVLLSIHKYLIYEFQRRNSLLGYLLILDGTDEDIKRFLKRFLQTSGNDFPGVAINSDSINIPHKFVTPIDSVFKHLLQSYNIVIGPYSLLKERVIGKSKFNLKKQIILTIVQDRVVIKQKEYAFDGAIQRVYIEIMNSYIKKYKILFKE